MSRQTREAADIGTKMKDAIRHRPIHPSRHDTVALRRHPIWDLPRTARRRGATRNGQHERPMTKRRASIKETGEELSAAEWARFDAAVAEAKTERERSAPVDDVAPDSGGTGGHPNGGGKRARPSHPRD